MSDEKNIGHKVDVEQPAVVSKAIDLHKSMKNNLQENIPQNGGEIKADMDWGNMTGIRD